MDKKKKMEKLEELWEEAEERGDMKEAAVKWATFRPEGRKNVR